MNILAFYAHPDDESMLMGGTLALLAEEGAHIHHLCATRGEGGETGEPPIATQENLGEVREQELLCAVQALGGVRSLTFLGYTDPRIGPDDDLYAFTDNLTLLAGQVAASIRQVEADVLITHGSNGEYGHPAHVLCFQAALTAVLSLHEEGYQAPLFYTPQANFPDHPYPRIANQDDPADMVLDITPVMEKKRTAALCHKTQHALFVRRSSEREGRQLTVEEIVMDVESLHRAYPKRKPGEPLTDPVTAMLAKYSRS